MLTKATHILNTVQFNDFLVSPYNVSDTVLDH